MNLQKFYMGEAFDAYEYFGAHIFSDKEATLSPELGGKLAMLLNTNWGTIWW